MVLMVHFNARTSRNNGKWHNEQHYVVEMAKADFHKLVVMFCSLNEDVVYSVIEI